MDDRAALADVEHVFSLLGAGDRRLLESWNATASDASADETVHGLFARVAAGRPDAVALEHGDASLCYGELEIRANRLAAHLRDQGLAAGQAVGVCSGRGIDAIVTLLGVLKAGGCYLPLDPDHPAERLAFMLRDAQADLVVVDAAAEGLAGALPGRIVRLERDARRIAERDPGPPAAAGDPQSPFCVLYTSGSTGRPKGVRVRHRSVVRLVIDGGTVELGPPHVLLHAAPLAFDASTFEIWGALLTGARLVIASGRVPTARSLRDAIERHGVTTLWLTAGLFNAVVDEDPAALAGLSQLLIGGEALSVPHVRRALASLGSTRLFNGYGPTEATTFTCVYPIPRELPPDVRSIPIGWPIRDTRLYVLDAEQRLVPIGCEGELYIGGEGVALGYVARPELTAERFVPDPFSARPGDRLYRSGDRVRFRRDGALEFLGRADEQVKIRGFRIEPGEIEAALADHPAVRACAVVAREDGCGGRALHAYCVGSGAGPGSTSSLRAHLGRLLPEPMLPRSFTWLDALPLTPSGKLDRQALPRPSGQRPALANAYVEPRSDLERRFCAVWSEVLDIRPVGVRDNFFELGGDSLLAAKAAARLRETLGIEIDAVRILEHPTIEGLCGPGRDPLLFEEGLRRRARQLECGPRQRDVAVIGMAGRFPGADSVEVLWRNLCAGVESTTFFGIDGLDPGIDAALRADPDYVAARGILEDVDLFDAGFFGTSPLEARISDPQNRVLLELAWETLENAGYVPERFAGSIGVFAGKYNNSYFAELSARRPDLIERVGAFQAMLANEKDYVAPRIAHALGLTGPAVSVHTACSTSLVAICEAVQSLRLGQCDMALAGGAAITVPVRSGYLYREGGMLSPDGRCRPFDAAAAGTVFSDGAALVLLKRLEDARADGDTIHAVIRGCAVNNDGSDKASFTAPSAIGQATVIATAHLDAGVDPRSLCYVETHGTATPLGDPLEIQGLARAFGAAPRASCAIGSIKSNFGHLVIAAGVAGFIKTALALERRRVPPTLHFRTPNPRLELDETPFRVNAELLELTPGSQPLRAGVSSFGVGGTNAHVVLEEAERPAAEADGGEPQLLRLSARSETALDALRARLGAHLAGHPGLRLDDVSHTLRCGRREFEHREVLVCADLEDARQQLARPASPAQRSQRAASPAPLVFLFPGQGSQVAGMGRCLYERDAAFRARIDAASEVLLPVLGRDLRTLIGPGPLDPAAAEVLRQTACAQPALFAVEFALAERLLAWGLEPAAMIGHSVGEFVAAALAGVWSFEDGLRLVAERGRLVQALPPGSMLSVRMPAGDLVALLESGDFGAVELAAVNAPELCVVAGPAPAVAALQQHLEAREIPVRGLHTSHAFHSSMLEAAVEPLRRCIEATPRHAPQRPFVSSVTGSWIAPEEATDPGYWAAQLRAPVRFASAVATLVREREHVYAEVGPRDTLATLAMQQLEGAARRSSLALLAAAGEDTEWESLLAGLGRLWLHGHDAQVEPSTPGRVARRVPLPTYPFERSRYWIDSEEGAAPPRAPVAQTVPAGALPTTGAAGRRERLAQELGRLFEDVSGLQPESPEQSFLELGADSLFLTQFAVRLGRDYGVKLTFRRLMEELDCVDRLAGFLDAQLPSETSPEAIAAADAPPAESPPPPAARLEPDAEVRAVTRKPFGAIARIGHARDPLDPKQQRALQTLVDAYTRRTKASREHAQRHRAAHADPRVVTGFKPDKKELVYPIVTVRSKGSRLWDLDGNEYVDALNGFGSNFFGHAADFIRDAIRAQLELGYEIGPQTPLAGECAALVCELTGAERAAFCNTGSEAVMGCMRIARTVTGRPLVVAFHGDYHGIFDEVIVRGTSRLRSVPGAAGIPPEAVSNALILDYGSDAALDLIRQRAHEIAAVLVEPVQSRRPDLQPAGFLRALRELTAARGTALIFDEVITGFRVAPGGAQAHFGVRADIASYGKVPGGGLPMGIIAGRREWMDALDGGFWQFGDDSRPEAGVTYFAGTFVRHPLSLAAVRAALTHLREQGPGLQETLNRRTARLAGEINRCCEALGAPLRIRHFSSLWKPIFDEEFPHADLLFVHLRQRGLHILDGFPCFLSLAHDDADVDFIVQAFKSSLRQMMADNFLPERPQQRASANLDAAAAPVAGARLGRDRDGNPAWYVEDPQQPGRWVKWDEVTP
jgi:amino acid adenylation domain-containing protein